MHNVVFILSHQDDEFGAFGSIKSAINKKNIYIFYMTNGELYKSIPKNLVTRRDKESLNVLKEIGVKRKNIFFFGRNNNIPTCTLFKNLKIAFRDLNIFVNKLKGNVTLITHAYEGGNEDHDSCNVLVQKLLRDNKKVKFAFQFPLYNAISYFYYSVQKPLINNGKPIKIKSNFRNRLKFIKYLFYYKSQLRVWIGLYPFLIFNLLFRNYFILQKVKKKKLIQRPHKKKLLYEKFREIKFGDLKLKFDDFLRT